MTNLKKPLPDILGSNLKILFVGYNPGIQSARSGHHYAGRSNRFWKLLNDSGLTDGQLRPENDRDLLKYGYGSTNIVDRTTKSAAEITPKEMHEGAASLYTLIKETNPRIVCYVGIGVYRAFKSHVSGVPKTKLSVSAGLQEESTVMGVIDFVCSNPSGLNTIPYEKQLECFRKLKQLI